MKKPQYTLEDFNQHHILKVPSLLFFTGIYLLKYPVLIILPWVPRMGEAVYLERIVEQYFHWSLLIFSCVPAGLVLVAAARRIPEADARIRWIWARGRGLLLFGLFADIMIVGILLLVGKQKFSEHVLVIGYLDLMFILYVWRSQRLRDVFSQFPEAK